jgi:hypothetical protein
LKQPNRIIDRLGANRRIKSYRIWDALTIGSQCFGGCRQWLKDSTSGLSQYQSAVRAHASHVAAARNFSGSLIEV